MYIEDEFSKNYSNLKSELKKIEEKRLLKLKS